MTGTEDPLGLRERKKLATRAALSWAALTLATERGLENTLVEDIAAMANVSPRTFSNYFSSKEEAIVAISTDRIAGIVAAFRARPVDEPLWESLIAAMLTPYDVQTDPPREFVARSQLMMGHPSLQAENMRAQLTIQDALTDAVAARMDVDPNQDIYPRLMVSVATAALHTALRHWAASPTSRPFLATLRAALEQVPQGLPEPRRNS
jgi:AcrR family transcriptional regulator